MPVFELSQQRAKLSKFSPRTEFHGQDPKPAGDLYFEANMAASDLLPMFSPELRHALYCKREDVENDLADQAHDLPNLRFSKLIFPLKWDYEIVGANVTIHRGIDARSDIVIETCVVNDFRLSPMEGGTCVLQFRVQGALQHGAGGALCEKVQQEVDVSVEPPQTPAGDDQE